jgi:hypothetical protein
MQSSFYPMKRRLGYRLSVRDKILFARMFTCPGWMGHKHPRKKVIFKRYQSIKYRHGHPAYTMYWRSHPQEYRHE